MVLLGLGGAVCNAINLFNCGEIGVTYKIIQNQQYVDFGYLRGSDAQTYIVRSLSIEITSTKIPIVVDFTRLYKGIMKFGDFPMAGYGPDLDIYYNSYLEKDSTNSVVVPRFPMPFNKRLIPNEPFTINLVFPDVLSLECIKTAILFFPDSQYKFKTAFIKEKSINVSIGNELRKYAEFIYEKYSKRHDNTLFNAPFIPYFLSDECHEKKDYLLSWEEFKRAYSRETYWKDESSK